MLAAVLPNADPLHKVTILPTGMALGVTQQMPEERHLHSQAYIEDSLCMRLGGRIAEELVFGDGVHRRPERPRRRTPSWPAGWCASGA